MRVEHEYQRTGAWAYLAARDVRRAKIHGRCERRTGIAPFERLVSQVMAQEPYRSARRVYSLLDNGSSHRGQSCVERLNTRWPTIVGVHTPIHASWLNQIEIYFSVVQRKVLTPNNLASLAELEDRLLQFQDYYEPIAQPFQWKFTRGDLANSWRSSKPTTTPSHGPPDAPTQYVTEFPDQSAKSTMNRNTCVPTLLSRVSRFEMPACGLGCSQGRFQAQKPLELTKIMPSIDKALAKNEGGVARYVDERRLWDRHMAMAEIGATPRGGLDRQALTAEDNRARALFARWADELGLACEMDEIGNMFVRKPGTDPNAAPVLSGSHLDTQPAGGRFDGIYGVLAALEAVQALGEAARDVRRPIEVVVWTNEEGTRFQPSLMGSAAFADPRQGERLAAAQDAAGITVERALVDARNVLSSVQSRPLGGNIAAYVEAHIEQGPVLEARNKTIGIVTGIQGWRRFVVDVHGEQGHAGTMPHTRRKDALNSACAIVLGLKELMHDPKDLVRLTIGRFNVSPNSPGVIPGHVGFIVDFRHPDNAVLSRLGDQIENACHEYAGPCTVRVEEVSREAPVEFDDAVQATIRSVAERLDVSWMEIYSGATHDALNLAKVCPTGMLFVPCERGISHNEAENAKPSDLSAGTRVLAEVLAELANE